MNLFIKLTSWSLKVLRKSYDFLDGFIAGFWLGILGVKATYRYTSTHYERTETYLNDNYNLSGLQKWEYDCIKNYFSRARTFLILGAGGGRETAALRNWGVEVDSYECSEKLVSYANDFLLRNSIDARVEFLPENRVPENIKDYNGIILGWGAYTHIQGSGSRISFLAALKPFCNVDTHVMISFLVNDGPAWKDRLTRNVSNFFRFFSRSEKTETGDRLLSYFAHFFHREEVEHELTEAGFTLLEYYDEAYGCAIAKLKV